MYNVKAIKKFDSLIKFTDKKGGGKMELVVSNIKRIINEKGLKQKFVAEKACFTEQEFSNLLSGRKRFDVTYVIPICKALDVNPNELFRK
jgi:transcriptional regulator with XRE-family HTH domain